MSRRIEMRPVEQRVAVYVCDRCESEMVPTRKFGVTRPGEGCQITAREYKLEEEYDWLPLVPVDPHEPYPEAAAANPDLCPKCLADLLVWFAEGKP